MIIARMFSRTELESLVRVHQDRLQWYLHYLGCPRDDIADLVQETFIRLLSAARKDTSPAATASWLFATARNLMLSHLRQMRRRPMFEDFDAADRVWREHEGNDEGAAQRAALNQCLEELRPKARLALELRHGERLSRRDIATRIDTTESGLKILLERARRRLRECVQRRLKA